MVGKSLRNKKKSSKKTCILPMARQPSSSGNYDCIKLSILLLPLVQLVLVQGGRQHAGLAQPHLATHLLGQQGHSHRFK